MAARENAEMAKVQFDISKVSAALAVLSGTQQKITTVVDARPARACGQMFMSLANGSFKELTAEDHSRLRHAATAIARSFRSEQGLKTLLTELGNDLMQTGRLSGDGFRRAKVFCASAVSFRS